MTDAPEIDAEDLVIAYLGARGVVPGAQISARMPTVPALPFILVQRVAGPDDFIVDYPTVSIHSFASDQTAASTTARAVHHAMRQLRPKLGVAMPDGSTVSVYAPTGTEQTPIFMPWEETGGGTVLSRYVARYLIAIRLPSIAGY